MHRKFLAAVFLCFSFFLLPGCGNITKEEMPLCRVVTQVDIIGQEKDVQIHRHYTDTEKMQWVLIYLRTLDPGIKPQTPPEEALAEIYEISLKFSDGSEKVFRQADHRYYSVGSHPWQSIEPGKASGLYALMRALPSDAVFAEMQSFLSPIIVC